MVVHAPQAPTGEHTVNGDEHQILFRSSLATFIPSITRPMQHEAGSCICNVQQCHALVSTQHRSVGQRRLIALSSPNTVRSLQSPGSLLSPRKAVLSAVASVLPRGSPLHSAVTPVLSGVRVSSRQPRRVLCIQCPPSAVAASSAGAQSRLSRAHGALVTGARAARAR